MEILHSNDMVDVQTWEPWKTIECDNSLGLPIMCFHPHNHAFIFSSLSIACQSICPKVFIKVSNSILPS